ncbi:MAG: zf-HC2 domain-containing protein [Eubacteriales bacterium]|nr:zf-HC2 domain-containing protein [Eubacteriales bacterium]
MTCLEAQSNIIAYIDHKLEKEEKIAFLKHIKCCDNCREELEIYYTMIVGMRQLDENISFSKDFSLELQNRMDKELKINKQKTGILRSSILFALVGIITFSLFAYVNFLKLLQQDEQEQLKNAQGEYYYSNFFDDVMFREQSHYININIESKEPESQIDLFLKVREYKMINE